MKDKASSEERFRTLFESVNDGIFLLDLEGNFIDINRTAYERLGYTKEEMLSMHIKELDPPEFAARVPERFAQIIKHGRAVFESAHKRKDGTVMPVEVNARTVDFDGERLILSAIRDITGRKQAEEALQESEEKFRSITASAKDAIMMVDSEGHVSYWNEAAEKIFGYTKEEAIGKELHKLILPQGFHEDYLKGFKKFRATGRGPAIGKTLELAAVRKDGTEFPVEVSLSAVKIKNKWNASGIIRDITKRKEAEEALQESEETYKALIESLTDGVVVHQQGKIVYVNTAAWKMLGYESAEEGIGKNALEFVHPDYRDMIKVRIKTILETGEPSPPGEKKFLCKDGSAVDVEVFGVLIKYEGKPSVQVVFRDITRRKKAEEALKIAHHELEERVEERTEQLQLLQDINAAINMGMSLKDVLEIAASGVREIFNYTACEIFLLDEEGENLILSAISADSTILKKIEKLVGFSALGFRVPLFEGSHFTEVVKQKNVVIMDDPKRVFEDFSEDKKLKSLAGSVAKIAGFNGAMEIPLVAENQILGVIGMSSNEKITEKEANLVRRFVSQIALPIRKGQLEDKLRDSEERYRTLFETAKDIIFIISSDGIITSLNPVSETITGWSRKELIGKPFVPLIHPDDSDMITKRFQRTLKGETSLPYELRVKRKSGGYFVGEVRSTPQFKDEKVVAILGIMRDITERKQAEEEMKRRLMRFSLADGNIYMVKEPTTPDLSIRAFNDLLNVGYDGIVISRTPEEKFREAHEGSFEFLWLAEISGEKGIPPNLKEIKHIFEGLPRKKAVLIDRLDYLIFKEGFEKTLSFVQGLRDLAYLSGNIFILSIDPFTQDKRELRLLEKETLEIEPLSKARLPEDLLEILNFVYNQNTQGLKPSYGEIGKKVGASKPTVRKRIKNLTMSGYIIESKKGMYKVIELTDKGRNLFLG